MTNCSVTDMRASTFPQAAPLSWVTGTYSPVPGAVGAARTLTVDACRAWHLPPQAVDVAELVTAELVGNAVRHARTRIDVTVSRSPGRLHIAVRDLVPAQIRRTCSTGGRGLLIVASVTTHWGFTPAPGAGPGKIVWAVVAS